MAWSLAPRLFRHRAAETPLIAAEPSGLPAGVVALGRGGAGEIGALLRDDGVYAGLLRLLAPAGAGWPMWRRSPTRCPPARARS